LPSTGVEGGSSCPDLETTMTQTAHDHRYSFDAVTSVRLVAWPVPAMGD
jgi:hypothetical protein